MFNVALESWQTTQMSPPEKVWISVPLAWNYLSLWGYDKWKYGFQIKWPGKFHSKQIQALENSNSRT